MGENDEIPEGLKRFAARFDEGGERSEGDKWLGQMAARLESGEVIEPVTVRELLRRFGAEYRGRRVNETIREVLGWNDLHIEPDLNQPELDDFIEFRKGIALDEIQQGHLDNRNPKPGMLLNEFEAALLNRDWVEAVSDCVRGWIDRNPDVTEEQVRAKALAVNELDWDEIDRDEGAEIVYLPAPHGRIGRSSPPNDASTRALLDESRRENYELVLKVLFSEPKMAPAERAAKQRGDEQLFESIGRFIYEFSQLEFMIRDALGAALNLTDQRADVIISPYDLASLCEVTKQFFRRFMDQDRYNQKEIESILNACKEVNNKRNVIAHGTWFSDEFGFAVRFRARHAREGKVKYSKIEELQKDISEVEKLKTRVSNFFIVPVRRPSEPPA